MGQADKRATRKKITPEMENAGADALLRGPLIEALELVPLSERRAIAVGVFSAMVQARARNKALSVGDKVQQRSD